MADFKQCVEGKTRREIVQALGQPSGTDYGSGAEVWTYSKWAMNVTDSNRVRVGANLYFDSGQDSAGVTLVEFVT